MRTLPAVTGRDEFDVLVVRTDYHDDQAWRDVTVAMMKPWGDRQYEAHVHFIDDPAWAGVTVDEALNAVCADENLAVVFLADRTAMQADMPRVAGDHHADAGGLRGRRGLRAADRVRP